MKSKKFLTYIMLFISVFISYHLIVYYFFTTKIFNLKDDIFVGDIGRMSYQVNMIHSRKTTYTLAKTHFDKTNYKEQTIDIITIGDSFSCGMGHGKNPYYQDFLATQYNLNILNVTPYKYHSFLETIAGLYNDGYLKKLKPKAIIVESVERLIPQRFMRKIDFNTTKTTLMLRDRNYSDEHQKVDIISTANYKIPYYAIKYYFVENAMKDIYKIKLNKKLFSINNGDEMLIFHEDLSFINKFTEKNILLLNNNLNKTAKLLKKLNIKLYFMPAPDKYDLYYEFIKDNKHPKNNFFEILRPLKKEYYFIDTKKILLPLLKKGVKDVYWVDDTHWSQKASSAIIKNDIFKNINRF